MRTNIEDIYSCGDSVEQFSVITGRPIYRPLGSTANKTGRITGDSMTGGNLTFRGILGTGILKSSVWQLLRQDSQKEKLETKVLM